MLTLRLMTYNIQGQAARRNDDHLERIARVIADADPDVACLQEVHCRTRRVGIDQAEELSRLTGLTCVFGRSCGLDGGDYGNAILTRCEILDSEVTSLPGAGEPRSVMQCDLRFGETPVSIFVTHLSAWGFLRRRSRLAQVSRLGEIVSSSTSPLVLAGDLNVPPGAPEIRALTTSGRLRAAGSLSDPTYRGTRQRLDYVFHGSRWKVRHTEVLRRGPSDHWPFLVELTLEDAS